MTNFNLKKNLKISLNINAELYELAKKNFKVDRELKKQIKSIGSFADLIECLLVCYLNHPIETLKELNFDNYIYTYSGKLLYPCKHVCTTKIKKYYLNYKSVGDTFIE